MTPDRTRFDLQLGFDLTGGDIVELWWRYVSFGGVADVGQLMDYVAGRVTCDALDTNRIAQALNEMFLDRGLETFPVGYANGSELAAMPRPPDTTPQAGRAAALDVAHRAALAASQRSIAMANRAALLRAAAVELVGASNDLMRTRRTRRDELARRRAQLAAIRSR